GRRRRISNTRRASRRAVIPEPFAHKRRITRARTITAAPDDTSWAYVDERILRPDKSSQGTAAPKTMFRNRQLNTRKSLLTILERHLFSHEEDVGS
ncbi:hypothetical protein, partial [Actinoplanes regularis]|uniref:hypothetical protein n=1 Tax=Actinoplanes regularis TaxID=52697 RepID=UPI0025546182